MTFQNEFGNFADACFVIDQQKSSGRYLAESGYLPLEH
jgi:hypothetical protein